MRKLVAYRIKDNGGVKSKETRWLTEMGPGKLNRPILSTLMF